MLGIDYNRLEEMVSRMESVAASMEDSSRRVLRASEKMEASSTDLKTTVSIDGQRINQDIARQVALAELDKKARK